MTESTLPTGDLEVLTAALDDPGTDLQKTLGEQAEHLAAASPPYGGQTMTVVLDGVAVTLTAGDRDLAVTSPSLVMLPASVLASDDPDRVVVFYAAQVSDFADLAAVVTRSAGRPLEQERSSHPLRVSGLAEFSARNQAIGVLIEQGHTPEEARIEIGRRATRNRWTLHQTAQDILDDLAVSTVSTRLTPVRPMMGAQVRRKPDLNLPGMHVRADTGTAHVRMRQPTSRARTGSTRGTDLTAPERVVLGQLVAGSSTAAIASTMRLAPQTVRNHTQAITAKLGGHSMVETVAIGLSKTMLGKTMLGTA